MAMADLACIGEMMALAQAGFAQGWHERNGGNASYRLTEAERLGLEGDGLPQPGAWEPLGVQAPGLGGQAFLVTAAGSYFQALADCPERSMGIVELDEAGAAWRRRWGFADGGRPTSEFAGHMLIHEARSAATDGVARAIYHAHPTAVVALSRLLPAEPRPVTRALWQAMTETVMVAPEGVGAVGCLVPGSLDLARASAEQMRRFAAVVWASHGLLVAGESLRDALGRMHALAKAADIYMCARAANGGSDAFAHTVPDATLRAIAESLGLEANEAFLGEEGA